MGLALRRNLPETGLALRRFQGKARLRAGSASDNTQLSSYRGASSPTDPDKQKGQAFDLSLRLCRRRDSNPNALADTRF